MPVNPETQKTMGYCFIEFNTPLVILSLPLSSYWYFLAKNLFFICLEFFKYFYFHMWNIQLPPIEEVINEFRSTQDTEETSFYLKSMLISQLVQPELSLG